MDMGSAKYYDGMGSNLDKLIVSNATKESIAVVWGVPR